MARFIFKRILTYFLSLFVVASLTFFMMKSIPGDPFQQEQAMPEEIMRSLKRHYGLDQPLYQQYFSYLSKLAIFSLGPSFKHESRTVNQIIADGFPVSLSLGICALITAAVLGITIGTTLACFHNRWPDHLMRVMTTLMISVPSFVIAILMQYVFSLQLNILPLAQLESPMHYIMPTITLSVLPCAYIIRLTKTNMLDVFRQDYMLTAKARGLSPLRAILKHSLKNGLLPVLTYIGHVAASIFTGSFVVEKIFGIPGLGMWFVNSIATRDYTVIMGLTVFYSSLLMLSILVVDILSFIIDPRLKNQPHYSHTTLYASKAIR